MQTGREAFLSLVRDFPAWMDIRKRPNKSVAGRYLLSIMQERDNLLIALDDYKRGFFLTNYIGKEDEIIDHVYVAAVGEPDGVVYPEVEMTDSARLFIENLGSYAMFLNGYIVLAHNTESGNVEYSVGDYTYGVTLTKCPVWNIFDEYALFLGLSRNLWESNLSLLKRCLLVFQNPANSTKAGMQNAIMNTLATEDPISRDEIDIQKVGPEVLSLPDNEYDTVYERLVQINHDISRTKRWDMDDWTHTFKELGWAPHAWDAPISVYQDGTGQNDDLQMSLTSGKNQVLTDVEVYGYVKSLEYVERYIHRNSIKQKITMGLKKYSDTLIPMTVGYRITAIKPTLLNMGNIFMDCYTQTNGRDDIFLDTIVTDPGDATVVRRNRIFDNTVYKLKFLPRDDSSSIEIYRILYKAPDGTEKDLRAENSRFKLTNGALRDTETKLHVTNTRDCINHENIIDSPDGMKIESGKTSGKIVLDVSGFGGQPVNIKVDTDSMLNITGRREYIQYTGFSLSENTYSSSSNDMNSSMDIDISCAEISFDFIAIDDPSMQGTASVVISINGETDTVNSGLWAEQRNYHRKFDKLTDVKIHIQKSGTYPIKIGNFMAARYDVHVYTEKSSLVDGLFAPTLPVLPEGESNSLVVEVTMFDSLMPYIRYAHIGSSTESAVYELDNIEVAAGGTLDIDSNCKVELYDASMNTIINNDYVTHTLYRNDSMVSVMIGVDVSNFELIESSSKEIRNTSYQGNIVSYITLTAGESIDSVTITGKKANLIGKVPFAFPMKLKDTENVYITDRSDSFIVYDRKTVSEKKKILQYNDFIRNADKYVVTGLPEGTTAVFTYDGTDYPGNIRENGFDTVRIVANESQKYIAYNEATLLNLELSNIDIVDTFSPSIPGNTLMYYEISVSSSSLNANAKFEKLIGGETMYESWSMGRKPQGIRVSISPDYSSGAIYNYEYAVAEDEFSISNNIELKSTYMINGEDQELSRFIITPPAGMTVLYDTDQCAQSIIVEEDGFNKLWYSNVRDIMFVSLDGAIIPPAEYSFLGEEGIIHWNDDTYVGKQVQVGYSYSVPVRLSYKSIDSLYDLVGYSVEAFQSLGSPVVLSDMNDGEVRGFSFPGAAPDRVIARCTNSSYQVTVSGMTVKTSRISGVSAITVNTGYYYDDGKEYYYFNNIYKEPLSRAGNIDLHNVTHRLDQLHFVEKSTNYIKDSGMERVRKEVLCNIVLDEQEQLTGISRLGSFSACDTYGAWTDLNMTISLIPVGNGYALDFDPQDDMSYAIAEITNGVAPDTRISFSAGENISATILQDIKVLGDHMARSVYAKSYETFERNGEYLSFDFDENTDTSFRYYLMIQGKGQVDSIVIAPLSFSPERAHQKDFDILGFEVEEHKMPKYQEKLAFDASFNMLDKIEILKDGFISTDSNVAYGLTKLFDSRQDDAKIQNAGARKKKEAYYSEDSSCTVIVTDIEIPYPTSIAALYVKVNDITISSFRNFTIKAYSSDDGENYRFVEQKKKTNLLQVGTGKIGPYLRVSVEMPANRVITDIEVYARYAEQGRNLYVKPYKKGTLVTKVYDTGYPESFRLIRIDGEASAAEKISLFIHGYREDTTGHGVWTEWYEHELNDDLTVKGEPHIFDNYRLFQFKMDFASSKARIKIKDFVMEVL